MTRALVIGGGIGGLTAARALGRAGIDVSVFERAQTLEEIQVGGAIHVWHNGMRGLQLLELGDKVAALGGAAAVVERAEMRNWHGKLLTSWSPKDVAQKVGAPTVGVIRPELHRALVDGVADSVLQLGRELTGFDQNGDGVVARFADGSSERGDILIGADGLHSTVRHTLRGDEQLRFARYASWQALCDFRDDATPPGLFWIVWGPGARFLFYRVGTGEALLGRDLRDRRRRQRSSRRPQAGGPGAVRRLDTPRRGDRRRNRRGCDQPQRHLRSPSGQELGRGPRDADG